MSSETKSPMILTDKVTEISCAKCQTLIDVSDLDAFTAILCPTCQNQETVPARLGSFLLTNLIGTGGMGGVYYATDQSLGRQVAIKVMLKSLGDRSDFVESFKREAQAVAKLNHPNIVQIYSFGQEKGQPYIVMELVTGERLDKLIEAGKPLSQSFVARTGVEIADALRAADEVGLLHGDVKPENILYDDKHRAKLVDFGIASFAGQGNAEGIWGTPYYVAPEKVRRQRVDARSDIYSLGATLFHALTLRPPFEGQTPVDVIKARLVREAHPVSSLRKDVDPQLDKVIVRMLAMDPARRYPTYLSLMGDLKRVVQSFTDSRRFEPESGTRIGKIIVTKKAPPTVSRPAATPAPTPAPAPPPVDDLPPPSTSRIVIRKKGSPTIVKPAAVTTTAPQAAGTSSPVPKKKRSAKGPIIIASVIIAIVAGAVATFFIMDYNKRKAELIGRMIAMRAAQSKADDQLARIQKLTPVIVQTAQRAQSHIPKMTNAIFVVLNETTELPPLPSKTPEKEPVQTKQKDTTELPPELAAMFDPTAGKKGVGKTTRPPASTKGTGDAGPTTATRKGTADAPPKRTVSGDSRDEAPPGMPSLEDIERSRKKRPMPAMEAPAPSQPAPPPAEEPKRKAYVDPRDEPPPGMMSREDMEAAKQKPPPKAAPPAEPPPEKPQEPEKKPVQPEKPPSKNVETPPADTNAPPAAATNEPAVFVPAKADPFAPVQGDPEIKRIAKRVLSSAYRISEMAEDAKLHEIEVKKGREIVQNLPLEPELAQEENRKMEERLTAARDLETAAKDNLAKMEGDARRVDELRREFEVKKAEETRAAEAAKTRQEEEEARKKAEEDRKALATTEVQQVQTFRNEVLPSAKVYKFSDAVAMLTAKMADMKTVEGKAALQGMIDRYTHLIKLKKFLIENLSATPFRWGFVDGRNRVDIVAANEEALKVTTRTVPWTELTPQYFVSLVDFCINRSKLGARTEGEYKFALGVYHAEFIDAKSAVPFVRDSLRVCPDLEKDLERVLPAVAAEMKN